MRKNHSQALQISNATKGKDGYDVMRKKNVFRKKNTIDNFVKQMTNRGEMLIFMAELVFLKFKELLIRKR